MSRTEKSHNEVHYLLNLERWTNSGRGDMEAANELVDFSLNSKALNGNDSGWKMRGLEHVIQRVRFDPVLDRAAGAMAVVALATNETPARTPSYARYAITRAATAISGVAKMYHRWANQYGDNHAYDDERNRNEASADKAASLLTPLFRAAIADFQKPAGNEDHGPGYLSSTSAVTEVVSVMPAAKGQQAAALEVWKDNLVGAAVKDPKAVGNMLLKLTQSSKTPKRMLAFAEREAKAFTSDSVGLRYLDRLTPGFFDRYLNRITGGAFNLNKTPDTIASRADEIHYGHKSFSVADPRNDALAKWQRRHAKAELPAVMDIADTGPEAERLQALMARRSLSSPAPHRGGGSSG